MQVKFPKPVHSPDNEPRITSMFLLCIGDVLRAPANTEMVESLYDGWRLESSRNLATVDGLIWG